MKRTVSIVVTQIRPANTYVGVGLRMNERFGSFRKRSTISATQGHRRREADPFPRGSMGARTTTPKFRCSGLLVFSMSSDSCRLWLWISRVYYGISWFLTVKSLAVLICTQREAFVFSDQPWHGGNVLDIVYLVINFVFLCLFIW